jgi:hypothetical protein
MRKLWYAALGGLALLAFHLLGASERKEKKLRGQRNDLVLVGSGRAKADAHQKGIQADAAQKNAVVAAKVGKKVVANIGKNNESIRDILDAFRADSVQ